jgi:hypothetical protein
MLASTVQFSSYGRSHTPYPAPGHSSGRFVEGLVRA